MTMANMAARKQARRFWGAMGAVMRHTSRSFDGRRMVRIETPMRRTHGFATAKIDARGWRTN